MTDDRSGLPPWHKYVVEQGYPPEEAEGAIKNSTKLMVERGYNVKSTLRSLTASPMSMLLVLDSDLDSVPHWP